MNEEEQRNEELKNEEFDDEKKESPIKTIFFIIVIAGMLYCAVIMFGLAILIEDGSDPVQIPQKSLEEIQKGNESDKNIDIWSIELSYYLNTSVDELSDIFKDKTYSFRLFKEWDTTKHVQALLPEDLPFYIICSSESSFASPVCIGFYDEQSSAILSALNLTKDMGFEDIVEELDIYYTKDKDYETAKKYEEITYYSVSYHVKQGIVYHFIANNPEGKGFQVFAECEYPPVQPDYMIQNVHNGQEEPASLDSWIGNYEYSLNYTSDGIVGSTPFWQYELVIFKCQGQYFARFENNGFQMETSFLARVTGDENTIEFHYIQECPESMSYYIERFDDDALLLTFTKENDKLLTTWYAMADYHNAFLGQSGKITGDYYAPKVSYDVLDGLLNKFKNKYVYVDYQILPKDAFYGCMFLDNFFMQFQSIDNLNGYNDFYYYFRNYFDNNDLYETFIDFGQEVSNGEVDQFVKYCNMQPVSLQSQPMIPENNTVKIAVIVYYEKDLNKFELEAGYSLVEFTVKRVDNPTGVNWKITDIEELGRNSQVK